MPKQYLTIPNKKHWIYNTKRTTIWSETPVLDPTKNIFRTIVLLTVF